MDATRFHNHFGAEANYWGENRDHALETWQYEVSNDDTRLGYWDWVKVRLEEAGGSKPPRKEGVEQALVHEIRDVLDGVEWDSDTPARIAELMTNAGYTIRDVDGP